MQVKATDIEYGEAQRKKPSTVPKANQKISNQNLQLLDKI